MIESMSITANLTPANLRQFSGSEQLFFNPMFRGINYTEGVKFVSDNGAAWLITDCLALCRSQKVRGEDFLVFILTVNPDKTATLRIEDGNDKVLVTNKYAYTDFPMSEFKLFYANNVLMLPSEY
jgi:hypothetical protein